MPGTGHPYEVLNMGDVMGVLDRLAAGIQDPRGRAWFTSAPVLCFVTQERFVATVQGQGATDAIHRHVPNPATRDILLAKAADGADLRVFMVGALITSGPDLVHVRDWIMDLPRSRPRMLDKLPRVTVEAAVVLADRWSDALSRKGAREDRGPGSTSHVCDGMDGRRWVELLDQDALSHEGGQAGHCVASYGPRLGQGTRIMGLRDGDGRSLVTMELLDGEGGLQVGQVRTGKLLASPRFQGDLLAVLRHLGVDREGDIELPACGVVLHGGTWHLVQDLGTPVQLEGVPCLQVPDQVHLLSVAEPGRTVGVLRNVAARYRGGDPSLWRANASLLAMDDLDILDQRNVALVANATWRHGVVRCGDLLQVGGTWMPWRDACVDTVLGGERCKANPEGDRGYVMAEGGQDVRDVLVSLRNMSQGRMVGLHADGIANAYEPRPRSWSSNDVRRVANVFSSFREVLVPRDASILPAGLVQAHGRWVRYQDHVTSHPCDLLGPLGPLRWDVTPWDLQLRRPRDPHDRSVARALLDRHGLVTQAQPTASVDPGPVRGQVAQELAMELCRMGKHPSPTMGVECGMVAVGSARGWGQALPAVVHDGTAWCCVHTDLDAVELARSCHARGQLTPSVTGIGLSSLEHLCLPGQGNGFAMAMLEAWCLRAGGDWLEGAIRDRDRLPRLVRRLVPLLHTGTTMPDACARLARHVSRTLSSLRRDGDAAWWDPHQALLDQAYGTGQDVSDNPAPGGQGILPSIPPPTRRRGRRTT